MKILILQDNISPEFVGGAGAVAYNLAKATKDLGYDVYIISTTQNKEDEKNYVQDGLKIYKIYSQYHRRWRAYISLYNPQTVKKVRKIIANIKPDVIHAHNIHYHLSYHCLKIAKLAGASVFLTAHDVMLVNYSSIKIPREATCKNFTDYCRLSVFNQIREYKKRYNPLRSLIIKHYLKKYVDKIFTVSDALKNILTLNGIGNLDVVRNGIDINIGEFDQKAVVAFKKRNSLEDKKIILFGGRISEEKGIFQIIQALDSVLREIPNALLLVAGSGARLDNVNLPIRSLGWLRHEEMKIAYSACDVLVVPSLIFDSFPTVILEAMAAKKPVVGTCFGGTPEIIIDGETGYIINPYDIKTIADRITDLLKNPEKAGEFGERGYKRAKDFFSLKHQAEIYLSFYVSKKHALG